MRTGFTGDIWRFHPDCWIVIPTNCGWTKDGRNVMGAGLAKDAALRWPELPAIYGARCKALGKINLLPFEIDDHRSLIMFPVKPLNPMAPHLSWKQQASLEMIESAAFSLSFTADFKMLDDREIAVPMVGCGNGRLRREDVRPILMDNLVSDRFFLVE